MFFFCFSKRRLCYSRNSHFDTTKGHIEFRKAHAIDCTIDEAFDINNLYPFKGNIDLDKLEKVYQKYGKEKYRFALLPLPVIPLEDNLFLWKI